METIFAYSCLGLELNHWARRETVCILPFKNGSKYKNLMLVLQYCAYDFCYPVSDHPALVPGAVWLQALTVSTVGVPWQQHCWCVLILIRLVAPTPSRLFHVCPTLPSILEDVFCPCLLLPLFFFLSPHHLCTLIRHIFFKARKDEMTPEFVCLEEVLPNN